jgi:hypothetical protein
MTFALLQESGAVTVVSLQIHFVIHNGHEA